MNLKDKTWEPLLRYSLQLAMLQQLMAAEKITDKEYEKIEFQLKRDYGIISNIST